MATPRNLPMACLPEQRAPLRVMVVDPDADAADSAAMLLRLWGYEARTAYSAPQALGEGQTYLPDVLLTELALPGHDGYTLSRQMRDLAGNHRLACVAVTGLGRDADRQRSEAEGFAYHLVKPVDPGLLRNIVQAFADRRHRARAEEAALNSNGTRRLLATSSNARAARSWLAHDASLRRRVHTMSVAYRSRSEELREKSHALRLRSSGLYRDAAHETVANLSGTPIAQLKILTHL